MEILRTIVLMLSLLMTIVIILNIAEAVLNRRHKRAYEIIIFCLLWGVFYYLHQI